MKTSILYEEEGLLEDFSKPIAKLNLDELSDKEALDLLDNITKLLDKYLDDSSYINHIENINQALVLLHFIDVAPKLHNLIKIPHTDNNKSHKTKEVMEAKSILFNTLIKAKDLDKAFEILDMFDDYKAPNRLDFIIPILERLDSELEKVEVNHTKRGKLKTIVKKYYQISINLD